jgi:PTH1 family peptidyl-tRNA hydrolase
MANSIRLVVGLGNPSSSYSRTRHNVGREFIEHLARDWGSMRSKKQVHYAVSPVDALGPDTGEVIAGVLDCFMNESGPILQKFLYSENISPEQTVVIVDDFMIPLGSLRLRPEGSSGGHNGLKSIFEATQSDKFGRLRVGIGPVPTGEDPANFVLQKFSKNEQAMIAKLFPEIETGLGVLVRDGYGKGMNQLNRKFFDTAAQ